MFEFPLIRFDDRQWLIKLQNGEFFMRNSLYYQKIEAEDLARSDPYDGSIPFPDTNSVMKEITGKETKNERIVLLNRFIKCFYHCTDADFTYIGGNIWKLQLSKEAMQEVSNFKVDSAMIIFNPSAFINQVLKECNINSKRMWYGDVKYLDDKDYHQIIQTLEEEPSECYKIPFYKRMKFKNQKEFRFCIHHPFVHYDRESTWIDIPKEVVDKSYSLQIGAIEDSCVMNINTLFHNGVLLDYQNEHYYVCEDEENA